MGAKAYLPVYSDCQHLSPRSDDAIQCLIRHVSVSMYHVVGSCKMGASDDVTAVVDTQLRWIIFR